MLPDVPGDEEVWIPLVDEPIGSIVEHDVDDSADATWAEQLANDPQHHEAVVAEVLTVAREVAEDKPPADVLGPNDEERARFSEFAKRRLAADT